MAHFSCKLFQLFAPSYLNFASLGSFFGHELSHSVTPRYFEYDRLLAPWTDAYLKDYLTKAQCFVGYYTSYYDKSAEQHVSYFDNERERN